MWLELVNSGGSVGAGSAAAVFPKLLDQNERTQANCHVSPEPRGQRFIWIEILDTWAPRLVVCPRQPDFANTQCRINIRSHETGTRRAGA